MDASLVAAPLLGLGLGQALDLAWNGLYREGGQGIARRCPACSAPPAALHCVPLLGALAGHRCHRCGGPLPWRSLLLPLGAALLGLLVALALEGVGPRLLGTVFATLFLALTFTDLERRLLPNRLIYPGLLLALAFSWVWPDRGPLQAVVGAAFGLAVLGAVFLLPRGGMGAGDVKMAALMGAVLGFPAVTVALAIGALAGGVTALVLLALRVVERRQYMPYGPFLALGALVGLLAGGPILRGLY